MDNIDDNEIPGLLEYISLYGITDSPVNRKAYRVAYALMTTFNEEMPENAHLHIWYGFSESLDTYIGFVGFVYGDGFVPMFTIHQAEMVTTDVLDIRCRPRCDGGDGSGCRVLIDPRPHFDAEDQKAKDIENVNERFMHCVQSWDGPVPSYEELAPFYNVRTEGEGGAEETD